MEKEETMRVLLLLVGFLMFVCTGCTREEEKELTAESDKPDEIIIVAVGDSLTAGYGLDEEESYPAVLGRKLISEGYNCRVINSGVSSETSSGALSRIGWVLGLKPDIVILETGANDGLRGIDPDMVEENIRQILFRLNDVKVITVLVGMKMVRNLGPVYVKRFNEIYPKLAAEFDTVFMPFFLENVAMKREMTISDGLHPNARGYKIIVENMYPYILEAVMKKQKL